MVAANELRMGNLFLRNGVTFKVDEFPQGIILLDSLEPIPLTEEWHNKFGVKRNGFLSFEYELPRKNNIDIKVIFNGDYVMLRQGISKSIPPENDIVSIWNKDLTKRDMFVHEWQNLYFSLTGEELLE